MKAATVGVIAEVLGISKVRVAKLASDGVLPRAGRGLFDIPACVQAFVRYKVLITKVDDGASKGLMAERARLTRAKADAAERDGLRQAGGLIAADQIEVAWLAVAGAVKTRLISIPTKTAARLASLKTPAEAQALLQKEIHGALAELSQTPA
jgi:phage terminase Nu1 subunit (DNA packaging protein)